MQNICKALLGGVLSRIAGCSFPELIRVSDDMARHVALQFDTEFLTNLDGRDFNSLISF